jgi:GNAT superfamily N-acetyltransferase
MLSTRLLPQVPSLKAAVSAWLLSEWPGWYGQGGPGDLEGDVHSFAKSESELPVGFVVFSGGEPIGFGALKQESIASHKHLSPWASAGYVLPAHRGRGVGAYLLQSIVAHARSMGYPHVYCGTSTARSLLQRAGWHQIERVVHAGKPLDIFRGGG